MFVHNKSKDAWAVCSGLVEQSGDVSQIRHHEFVADTIDGGLATYLTNVGGHTVPAFAQGPDEQPMPSVPKLAKPGARLRVNANDKLRAGCHCGGVEFLVTPPSQRSRYLSSPWPDLLVPYHSHSSENLQDVKWWLRAEGTKYLAGLCACRSCRLAAGFPIQSWSFIPKTNLIMPDGTPMEFDILGLQQYESSPGIFREFCRTCGATVFWHANRRPELIDVSVGLLRADSGARAEDWLEWAKGRISFIEDAHDQELVSGLLAGMQETQDVD